MAMNSLQPWRHTGTAHMTGMLSWTSMSFLGKADQRGDMVKSNWNILSSA